MFEYRHIEYNNDAPKDMLSVLKLTSLDELMEKVLPSAIKGSSTLDLPVAMDEYEALAHIKKVAQKNSSHKSFIGQGYYNTILPSVIKRNILENPGWYTAYTAYQAEISQGRLEALFNFQTLTSELTGLPISNASLLDEGTALAEAAMLAHRYHKSSRNVITVIDGLHVQNEEVLRTRLDGLEIGLEIHTADAILKEHVDTGSGLDLKNSAALVLQLPTTRGLVYHIDRIRDLVKKAHEAGALVIAVLDPMFLVLAGIPKLWGIDIAVGSFQRFGVSLGYGGPHAGYLSTREEFTRLIPGRIVGQSKDTGGRLGYRFAIQTREQHIRREKATSNICTSQVLLAVISSMYAIYHGKEGLERIALRIFSYACRFARQLKKLSFERYKPGELLHGELDTDTQFFDTITWYAGKDCEAMHHTLAVHGYNIRKINEEYLSISFDETVTEQVFEEISALLNMSLEAPMSVEEAREIFRDTFHKDMVRDQKIFLSQEVFNSYHTETEMMRYCRSLMDKDLALDRSMIPLGSCTMKLNASSELMPISWEGFANIHPFVPLEQAAGYAEIIQELEQYLCEITGYHGISLQPNAGSQGEYAGLLAIKAYHASRGDAHRNICLIPSSAHGTNPASAQMAHYKVVVVVCDKQGNIDKEDLESKAKAHSDNLAVLMITYPSTHGVYEADTKEICDIVHEHGGQVYIDGANLNALVGVVKIADLGADVSHLNLHKTFAIPHGGGGPGVGPIGVKAHLMPYLPRNIITQQNASVGAVSSAPWGSALVLVISWMYIRMMGAVGLSNATKRAVLHANYIAARLSSYYTILYKGQNNMVAHECILDLREYKECKIEVEDVAKRLIDYGFHAPTMSWPVVGTLMIEPTESESKFEIDRFCDAMISIHGEIMKVKDGIWKNDDNPLVNAPHCAQDIISDTWEHCYPRTIAAFPYDQINIHTDENPNSAQKNDNSAKIVDATATSSSGSNNSTATKAEFESKESRSTRYKYWPPISRIDSAYGDKNLVCTCPPLKDYL